MPTTHHADPQGHRASGIPQIGGPGTEPDGPNPVPSVTVPADATLASLLAEHRVAWDTLHQRYGALLELVHALIGVVPNCERYLQIWEPAFRIYNILVPHFLNVPFSIFGVRSAPAEVVGMGMYVSSRTAECPYYSAHGCSFCG